MIHCRHQILFVWTNKREWNDWDMWHVFWNSEMCHPRLCVYLFMWHVWWSKEMLSVLVGKHERKRPLGWLERRLEDNINIDIGMYGIYVVKNRKKTANSYENSNEIRVPLSVKKFMISWRTVRSSRSTLSQCCLVDQIFLLCKWKQNTH